MIQKIPKEVLDAAHRRFCRKVAAQIINAMADSDTGLETIDSRVEWSTGATESILRQLVTGDTDMFRELSDLSVALHAVPVIEIVFPQVVNQIQQEGTE